jgi:hypothetical protein
MIGRVLPAILGRGNASQAMDALGAMDAINTGADNIKKGLDTAVQTMKGVGEPTSISTPDSGSEYTQHPAKM